MERALGIGGLFIRAADPAALARWYHDALGIEVNSAADDVVWWPEAGPTVVAAFPADTDYFGRREQGWMLNVRVRDLAAMQSQLREMGATVLDDTQELEGIGWFGWVVDPEGNRIELWQPAPEAMERPGT